MGLLDSDRVSRDRSYSGNLTEFDQLSITGLSPSVVPHSIGILLAVEFVTPYVSPTTPTDKLPVWAISCSLAATREVEFSFSSCGYLDVSVLHVRPACLCIQHTVIQESRDQRSFDSFPRLFAVFHALHRLLAPRHPPHALTCLATLIQSQKQHQNPKARHCIRQNLPTRFFRPETHANDVSLRSENVIQMPLRLH